MSKQLKKPVRWTLAKLGELVMAIDRQFNAHLNDDEARRKILEQNRQAGVQRYEETKGRLDRQDRHLSGIMKRLEGLEQRTQNADEDEQDEPRPVKLKDGYGREVVPMENAHELQMRLRRIEHHLQIGDAAIKETRDGKRVGVGNRLMRLTRRVWQLELEAKRRNEAVRAHMERNSNGGNFSSPREQLARTNQRIADLERTVKNNQEWTERQLAQVHSDDAAHVKRIDLLEGSNISFREQLKERGDAVIIAQIEKVREDLNRVTQRTGNLEFWKNLQQAGERPVTLLMRLRGAWDGFRYP